MVWSKKLDLPGPKKLIGGNKNAGFYGECPASEFITGDELAKLIGLTDGASQFSNEPWLKFSYLGNVEYIAKKIFRHSISWNDINRVNAVFGNRIILINGNKYKVRLPKGKTEGKQDDVNAEKGSICHNSEWNRLLLPIHENAPSNWKNPNNVKFPTENWHIGYTDDELSTDYKRGELSYSICQDYGDASEFVLTRGGNGPAYSISIRPTARADYIGWRPVLEFVK